MQKNTDRDMSIGAVSQSVLIVMALTLITKVTGFLRVSVLGSRLGATELTDALITADSVPCFILGILITALCATLIPVYSERLKEGRAQANRFIGNLMTVSLAASAVILLITFFLIEPIVNEFLLKNAGDEAKRLAVYYARIMMPMGFLVLLARAANAYLQANFRFTVPAVSQVVLNVVMIASILVATKENAIFVALGTIVGWALQIIVQIPSLKRAGFSYRPSFDIKDKGLREFGVLMLPVLVSSAFDAFYLYFARSVASHTTGDILLLENANKLYQMVTVVLLTTIATVLYPSLVRHVDDRPKVKDDLSFGVNLNLLVALPATAALILLSGPITRIVFQRGEFTPENTAVTASILACFAAGIFGVGMRELCNRCFYAFQDKRVPTIVGLGVVVLNIGLNYALYPLYGVSGVAVATAVSSLGSGLLLLYLLHKKRGVFDAKRVGKCLWKSLAATAVMSAALLFMNAALRLSDLSGMPFYGATLGVIVVGLLVYAVALLALRSEEVVTAVGFVKKKLGKG